MAALGGYARALYLAGDLEPHGRRRCGRSSIRTPPGGRRGTRSPGRRSRSSPPIVDGSSRRACTRRSRSRSSAAPAAAEAGSAPMPRRPWAACLAAEGHLAEAERELATAEHFFRDEVATVHHAWLLVVLARVRCRRGRLDDGQATLAVRARARSASSVTAGRVPSLADDVERGARGARAAGPRAARSSIRRARPSWRCSGCWRPTCRPGRSAGSCSSRRTRSGPIPARSTASSPSTPAPTPSPAPTRWDCSGKRESPM